MSIVCHVGDKKKLLETGDVSRIQYTFNNTDPEGYWPVPCKVDFPEKIGENQWVINHCPNIVRLWVAKTTNIVLCLEFSQSEGTYNVQVSAFNPLDGWFSTEEVIVEVLSRCGPITIDDYTIITDAVSSVTLQTLVTAHISKPALSGRAKRV